MNLILALRGPDGQTVLEGVPVVVGDTQAYAVWITQASGSHTLEVSTLGLSTIVGTYELTLAGPRPATPEDQRRLLAQSLRLESRRLVAQPDRERLAQAGEKCQEGLAIARELGDEFLEGRFHACMGTVQFESGDERGMFESAQKSFALERGRYPRQEAASRVDLAMGYMRTGDYQRALEHYEQARALFHSVGDTVSEAIALGNLGVIYCEIREYPKALQLYAQARPIFQSQRFPLFVARNHNLTGNALRAFGQPQRALDHYRRALALFEAEKRDGEAGVTLAHIGKAYLHLHQTARALDFLNRGLALIRKVGNPGDEAFALESLGDVYQELGQHQQALDQYAKSLPLAIEGGRFVDHIGTLVDMAAVERDRGNLAEARRRIEKVIHWADLTRQGLLSEDLRVSYSALLRSVYDVEVDVLMRLHAQNPAEGLDRAALELSERGRGQTLLEMLREARVDVSAGIDPALLQRAAEVRDQLRAKAVLHPAGSTGSPELEKEIGALTRQQDQIRSEIRNASPRYASLDQPTGLSVPEIQALLDDDTVLLEYQIAERSYLWAASADSLASISLGQGDQIEALARRLHRGLTARNRLPANATAAELRGLLARAQRGQEQAAAQLSEKLLGPLAPPRGKRLAIVADGALHYIPFAALPLPASWGGGGAPLVSRYEIVSLPSASVLALLRHQPLRERPPKEVAVFADPVFDRDDGRVTSRPRRRAAAGPAVRSGPHSVFSASAGSLNLFRPGLTMSATSLPRLEYTRELAAALLEGVPPGDRFKAVDFAASREAALAPELAQYRRIVFATHGLLNAQYPELSGIALSMVDERGRPQDGFLRLQDVYNLKLNADLVVLGACETGLGKEVRGEGLIGLSRGFMYAGVPRLLASLWKVDEEATMALLREFHQALRRGHPFPAALREAQLRVRQQPRWSSPYFWAGFVLQGEWRGPETRNE